jgi:hypothetical protein
MLTRLIPKNAKWWLFACLLVLHSFFFIASCADSPNEADIKLEEKQKEEKDDTE